MTKVIVTGGCGFVGHHMVEHILKNTDWEVYVVDKLSYSSFGYDRLRDISVYDDARVHTINHDFVEPVSAGILKELDGAKYFIHMAAESHVDNSIDDPVPFIRSNVLGTHYALEAARSLQVEKFIYFSTDEVFGPAPKGVAYKEWDRYRSSNPYAATKAGGEELAIAYENTYGIPVIVTHTMNIFGERQHPEKFIPLAIRKILSGEELSGSTPATQPTQSSSSSRKG
jgi:dTDP-glucose 4,6-dehydratase